STEMRIYFITGLGLSEDDPSDIYIGRYNINPPSRVAKIYAEMAKGKPTFGPPGTYIWNNGFDQWSVVWLYSDAPKEERGAIAATTIYDIIPRKLEIFPKNEAYDRIFINQQGVGFLESNTIDLKHQNITRAVAIEDFNNDGWPDILGIRGSEPGTYNGDPFLIVNYGGLKFKHQKKITLKNKEDDIGQADQLVVGFINNDGLPDVFITNGHGLAPGNKGPYKLFINKTKTENNYTIIELEGSISTKDALGAKVSLYTKKNKFLGYQELGVGYNRMQSTHKLHFGLGKYNGVLKAKIHWPSGVEQFIRVKQNKINHIKEKE
ncbi:MAG: CRTAC1 family protein, partial [Candidatus Hodarchaeota archaeon]